MGTNYLILLISGSPDMATFLDTEVAAGTEALVISGEEALNGLQRIKR